MIDDRWQCVGGWGVCLSDVIRNDKRPKGETFYFSHSEIKTNKQKVRNKVLEKIHAVCQVHEC